MIQMALLTPSKETENKLRWSTFVENDETGFHFYIPKWRVPEPWPGRVFVGIQSFDGDPSTFVSSTFTQEIIEDSIKVLLKPVKAHGRTVRYAPLGDQAEWQVGEPYIPYSLIPPDSHYLIIEIMWDLNSKGHFVDVPTYRQDPSF